MSFSYWLHNAAIRGCLIGLTLLLPGLALGQIEPKPEEPSAHAQPEKEAVAVPDSATLLAIFDELVKIYTAEKAANASAEERKERREEALLIAQRDAALWAMWAAIVAGLSWAANLAAIALVWLTFRETRKTAKAAVDAAEATIESVDLDRRAFASAHRPKLRVRRVYAPLVDGQPIAIQAEIANVGDADAVLASAHYSVEIGRGDSGVAAGPTRLGSAGTRGTIYVIRPGGHLLLKLTTNLAYRTEAGVRWDIITVRGELTYRDVFPGRPTDVAWRQNFQSVERKTSFERFQHAADESGRMRFVKGHRPDPEYEYED